jgi:rhomboid protease GluP
VKPGSALLLAALGAVFALELARGATGHPAALLALGALPDAGMRWREPWRLLAYAFLHWNAAHLLANAALLAWLAPALERRVGALRLWTLFLVAAFASGLAIVGKHALHPAVGVTVGASGGAFAVLAATAWRLWRDPEAPRRARIVVTTVGLLGLAVSLLPGVSLLGHVAGALVGIAFALAFAQRNASTAPPLHSARSHDPARKLQA